MSADSRLLNERLAMGTLGVSPSRSMGGLGFHKQRFGHVSLLGKTYCLMYGLGSNNAFDNFLLPYSLLLDGAAADANGLVWSSHHANQIFKHQLAPVAPRARPLTPLTRSAAAPTQRLPGRQPWPPPASPRRRSISDTAELAATWPLVPPAPDLSTTLAHLYLYVPTDLSMAFSR